MRRPGLAGADVLAGLPNVRGVQVGRFGKSAGFAGAGGPVAADLDEGGTDDVHATAEPVFVVAVRALRGGGGGA